MEKLDFNGWQSYSLQKNDLQVCITPQLGGRIMKLSFDGYNYLFVNPNLIGKDNIQPTQGWDKTWQNFGGEKVWPAPQGWSGKQEWPGPPDPILDGGFYKADIVDENSIRLTSPADKFTSLQIERLIQIDSQGVNIKASFRNIGRRKIAWSIWPVIQLNTPDDQDDIYRITIPVNSNSIYGRGYKVMHGLVNNPQYKVEGDNVVVDCKYLIGKIGLDSDAGWVAFCDRSCGKVLIAEYTYYPGAEYPQDTSVQIWNQGRGMFYSRNTIRILEDNRNTNPSYSEVELLSPIQQIEPGNTIDFDYRLKVCTIPSRRTVTCVNKYAVIADRLSIDIKSGTVLISGSYGFFENGYIQLKIEYDNRVEVITDKWSVSPLRGLMLEGRVAQSVLKEAQQLILEFINMQENIFIIERKIICKI